MDEDWICAPMAAIKGRVVYSGDAITRQDFRGHNSIRCIEKLANLSLLMIAMIWPKAEWVFGLAPYEHVSRGLAARYGAANIYPGGERWISPPRTETGKLARENNFWFLSTHRDDVVYRAECIVNGLLFGPSDKRSADGVLSTKAGAESSVSDTDSS